MARGVAVSALTGGAATSAALFATRGWLPWWCLGLTVAQALAQVLCSQDRRSGWVAGLALQPLWAAYSVCSDQPAFLITTTMVAGANLAALRRHQRPMPR